MIWARVESRGNPDWVLQFDTGRRSSFTLGRHPSCSLVLSDMHISSKHLSITQRVSPEGLREVVVEDSSSNGTWIDAERLERGVPVRLLNGSEIVFPCEDVERDNYCFVFKVLADPNQTSAADVEQQASEASSSVSPLSSEEASYAQQEQNKSAEQWQALEKVQDELTAEASRLAASIYMNDSAVENLRRLAKEGAPQEEDEDAGTTIFKSPEDAIIELKTANENLTSVIEAMVGAMQAARSVLEDSLSISEADRDTALEALHLDKFEEALEHLVASQTTDESLLDSMPSEAGSPLPEESEML
ncbi:Serine/threonine-protein kinase cds1 [Hondaea fermentalgiana]|uniref:Serine/threonine-protein kinase cds1 n=1 Tax=Hondaea fermentalgiana TaxID=2315210 RepID=A0A2R5GEA9_9STRA|nr:Serine/threonine-protein kinase cds1 [Hondaea fermentalgiana]|eukprot:GBG28669.1 Serine/threonine-protein kinase cds1 [Hondaea fermentalgiana]